MADMAEANVAEQTGNLPEETGSQESKASEDSISDDNESVSDSASDQIPASWKSLEDVIRTNDDDKAVEELWKNEGTHDALLEHELSTRPGVREKRVSPLMLAAAMGRDKIVHFLLKQKVDVLWTSDRQSTAFHYACQQGHLTIAKVLLKADAKLLEMKDDNHNTALTLASYLVTKDMVEFLVDAGANIYNAGCNEDTALHNAAFSGSKGVAQVLIMADHENRLIRASNKLGMCAFDTAVLMKKEAVAHLLLEKISEIPEARRDIIIGKGSVYGNPIVRAAYRDMVSLVLKLLKLPPYLPSSPAKHNSFHLGPFNNLALRRFVERHLKTISNMERQNLTAVFYWAVLNGEKSIIIECLNFCSDLTNWEREGATWAHVAAIGGDVSTMEYLLTNSKMLSLDISADGKITPLHLAAKYGHVKMVEYILDRLEKVDKPLEAILKRTVINQPAECCIQDGETIISLAVSGRGNRYEQIEKYFWTKLRLILSSQDPWADHIRPYFDFCLELAAQFERPRNEENLRYFLGCLPCEENYPFDDSNTLHLAVYHRRPTVVWWLLSHGSYLNETDIKKALDIATDKGSMNQAIQQLLYNPPPVQKQRAPRDDDHLPDVPSASLALQHDVQGAIVDLYPDGGLKFRLRAVDKLIYQDGPNKIMNAGPPDDLDLLKTKIDYIRKKPNVPYIAVEAHCEELMEEKTPIAREAAKKMRKKGKDEQIFDEEAQHDWRWIHIPANNLRYVEDLIVQISRGSNTTNKHYRPLAQFVKKSWAEISAGGGKTYMKPQYKVRRNSEEADEKLKDDGNNDEDSSSSAPKGKSSSNICCALYMPFIYWANMDGKTREPRKSGNADSHTMRIIEHESMTLDQYYYLSLEHTENRDKDQVLGRYMGNAIEKLKVREWDNHRISTGKPDMPESRPRKDKSQVLGRCMESEYERFKARGWHKIFLTGKPDKQKSPPQQGESQSSQLAKSRGLPGTKILMVHQLWLWIIDDKTVITSTTTEPEDATVSFFQRVLTALQLQDKESHICPLHLMQLALVEATGLLNAREIEIPKSVESLKDNSEKPLKYIKKSPLEVFRESILNVRNQEAALFENFQRSLVRYKNKQKQGAVLLDAREEQDKRNEKATEQDAPSSGVSQVQKEPSHSSEQSLASEQVISGKATMFTNFRSMWRHLPQINHVDGHDLEGRTHRGGTIQTQDSSGGGPNQPHPTLQEADSPQIVLNVIQEKTQQEAHGTEEDERQVEEGDSYGDIIKETNLLREVKDIIDELNILKNLTEDQELIWKQVCKEEHIWKRFCKDETNTESLFTYETPTEIKEEITEMINEAGYVEKSLNTLLDLKQKQANIIETLNTRRQSDTVMIFTVITIIFLPASFLTSLLALNVSDFPHVNDSLQYQGKWIFPIIIFVSLGVSLVFSLVAFQWSSWRDHLTRWQGGPRLTKPTK